MNNKKILANLFAFLQGGKMDINNMVETLETLNGNLIVEIKNALISKEFKKAEALLRAEFNHTNIKIKDLWTTDEKNARVQILTRNGLAFLKAIDLVNRRMNRLSKKETSFITERKTGRFIMD